MFLSFPLFNLFNKLLLHFFILVMNIVIFQIVIGVVVTASVVNHFAEIMLKRMLSVAALQICFCNIVLQMAELKLVKLSEALSVLRASKHLYLPFVNNIGSDPFYFLIVSQVVEVVRVGEVVEFSVVDY